MRDEEEEVGLLLSRDRRGVADVIFSPGEPTSLRAV